MANYAPPNYGAYDQPSAPYAYPPNTAQPGPGFVPPPYPSQPGYPPQSGYPAGYPPQTGYPPQQGYPAPQAYVGGQPVTVAQPGYYPGQPGTQTVVHQHQKEPSSGSGDCMRNCCLCALCMTLCCWCCSD